MPNRNLAKAVRVALITAGAAGAGLYGPATLAQETGADRTLEEIVVTGTRIRTPGLVSNSPISSVDAVEINLRQPTAVEDFLKQLPSAAPALGPGTNNGAVGAATVNLRGLGAFRNLVLVDGRRLVPFNLDGLTDTNVIPVAMLERVDVVTGGASAVYGADAVSGVVNFILRRDFEGVDISGNYGTSDRGDADQTRVDLTVGVNSADGRGNIVMGLGYTQRDAVLQGARRLGEFSLGSVAGNREGSSAGVPSASVLRIGDPDPDTGVPANILAQYDPALGQFVPFFES